MKRSVRAVAVGDQQLRVAVRAGDGTRTPLVLANGIGASLELLQPFVDHLNPSTEVVRFDPPGVGGSPLPTVPYRLPRLARLLDASRTAIERRCGGVSRRGRAALVIAAGHRDGHGSDGYGEERDEAKVLHALIMVDIGPVVEKAREMQLTPAINHDSRPR